MPPGKSKTSQAKKWWDRVQKAKAFRKTRSEKWNMLIEAYKPNVEEFGRPEDVKTNIHFRNVEQKKAQLFFQRPEFRLIAKSQMQAPATDQTGQPIADPQTGQPITAEDAITVHEEVLNYFMGPDKVNLPLLVDRLLFDCLCPSGMMVSKIGYRPYFQEVEQPVMQPVLDPLSGGPALDPMTGQPAEEQAVDELGEPLTEKVPITVKEEYFWRRVSPTKVLIPSDFRDTDFSMAPWLGVEFTMNLRDAKRLYKLPRDFEGNKGDGEKLLGKNNTIQDMEEETVEGVEIWYKAHFYREDIVHPDVYWQLVLIQNHASSSKGPIAVEDRMSPYQEVDPETLKLSTDSMLGNPIHIGTVRDLSDSAYVPSDSAMTHTLVKEIDTYRSQTVKLREANLTRFLVDSGKFDENAIHAMETGDVGQFIFVEEGTLAQGPDSVIAPVTKGTNNRTDSEGAFALESDMEKTLAIGANQSGGTNNRAITATESSIIQNNTSVRLEKEQNRVLAYVLQGVRKFDALLQRFADDDEVVSIVGQDGVRRLQTWNRGLIAGRFAYNIFPDSQLRLDAVQERSQWLEFYNLTAQDPFNNRQESLKKGQRLFGMDPSKGIIQPPEPGPPPPNVSFRFAGEDLFNPMVREIIAQSGYEISPESIEEAGLLQEAQDTLGATQPGVPGTAERLPPVSKRQEGLTGELPGPEVGG